MHPLLGKATIQAEQQLPALLQDAQQRATKALSEQQQRLSALRRINPSVRHDEIEALQHKQQQLTEYINKARLKLDAIRLIVVSHD